MVIHKRKPTIEEGVGILSDVSDIVKKFINTLLGRVDLEDSYLFIDSMEPKQQYFQNTCLFAIT